MKRILVVLVFVVLIVGISNLQYRTAAQVVEEPPTVVSPTYIAVPPRQQEIIAAAPSPQYVWIPGQWERTPASWSWTVGKWVQPPFSNAYWVSGYWKYHGGKYVWQPAHWAAANQGVVVAKPVTLPPVYAETQPPAPAGSTNLVWQPGYWDWRGTWLWVPGEYIQTTTPKAVWVPGAWVADTTGMWRWSPAHWQAV
jgi:hypothetical protein